MEIITEALVNIIQILIIMIGGLICKYGIPFAIEKIKEAGIFRLVKAAEKKYGSGTGEVKRDYVKRLAIEYLKLKDNDMLDALIESCCEQLDLIWAEAMIQIEGAAKEE